LETDLLALLDAAVYASAIAGVVMLRRPSRMVEEGSFRALGDVLRARFPDLPAGFTLREGLAKAREVEPGLDWNEIDQALASYEGYRYGGLPDSGAPQPALSSLISVLRRSGR
jgi:hypothetical protein